MGIFVLFWVMLVLFVVLVLLVVFVVGFVVGFVVVLAVVFVALVVVFVVFELGGGIMRTKTYIIDLRAILKRRNKIQCFIGLFSGKT